MKRGYIYSIIFLMCIVSTTIAQDTKPQWIESIRVLSPLSCSEVSGRVKVRLQAKGLTHLQAQCFVPNRKNPYAKPQKLVLTPNGIKLNNEGIGTFTINTRALPHGPLNVTYMSCSYTTAPATSDELPPAFLIPFQRQHVVCSWPTAMISTARCPSHATAGGHATTPTNQPSVISAAGLSVILRASAIPSFNATPI